MKNIHVLPTDKPSRLYYSRNNTDLLLSKEPISFRTFERSPQNIYITSDEEIKEGDWFMSDFNSYPLHNIKELSEREGTLGWKQKDLKNNLKIILTTDQDLIKDGVQAIPDGFLEWFVDNPSCEYVEIVNNWDYNNKGFVDHSGYKIIIPKEEVCSFCDGTGQVVSSTTISRFKTCDCKIIPKEESKQETLEEVAQRIFNGFGDITKPSAIKRALELVKWQQEQDKNKYSEEEVLKLLLNSEEYTSRFNGRTDLKHWFEQIKKK